MDRESEKIDFIIEDGVLTGCSLKKAAATTAISSFPTVSGGIGYGLFRKKWQFRTVRLPEGLSRIGESALENAASFSAVHIPDSVTVIGNYLYDLFYIS